MSVAPKAEREDRRRMRPGCRLDAPLVADGAAAAQLVEFRMPARVEYHELAVDHQVRKLPAQRDHGGVLRCGINF
jgi:hypothetical protein